MGNVARGLVTRSGRDRRPTPQLSLIRPHIRHPAKAPIQRSGLGKCSAVEDHARRGACPPLGSGQGPAESTG